MDDDDFYNGLHVLFTWVLQSRVDISLRFLLYDNKTSVTSLPSSKNVPIYKYYIHRVYETL